jgi:hypothetical protein
MVDKSPPPSSPSKLDVQRMYKMLHPETKHAIADDATLVLQLPDSGGDLWASIGGKSRTYQEDVKVVTQVAAPPVQSLKTSTGRPKPVFFNKASAAATSSTTTGVKIRVRDEYEQEKSVIATIVNNGIGSVVSLMNNVIVPSMGEAKSSVVSHGSIQNDELDENLGSFSPAWFTYDTLNTAIYNFKQGTANFGDGFVSELLPLDANGQVYQFWLNPSVLIRKVRFYAPNGQADVVHFLFRSWQDNGIPINLADSVELVSKRGGDPNNYSDLIAMLKAIYTIQGYYATPLVASEWSVTSRLLRDRGFATTETFVYDLQRTPNVRNMLVHCAAGIGRTGTFLTLYRYLWPVSPASMSVVDIINAMRVLRRKRMVYTAEQLGFIIRVLDDVHRNKDDFLITLYPDEATRQLFLKRDTPEGRYGSLAYLATGGASPSNSPIELVQSYDSPHTRQSRSTSTSFMSPRNFQSPPSQVTASSSQVPMTTPTIPSVSAAFSALFTTTPTQYGTPPPQQRYR